MGKTYIKLKAKKLNYQACLDFIQQDESGGNCIFVGTVRSSSSHRQVKYLEFECYEKMALNEFDKIIQQTRESWAINNIYIEHRLEKVDIGEAAVIIGVSSAHRAEAFEACRYIIDSMKQTVPIWKKEILEDGEIWVSAHP